MHPAAVIPDHGSVEYSIVMAYQSAGFRYWHAVRQHTACPRKIGIGRADIVISGKHGLALTLSCVSPAFLG
jgi:hypothetical protein